MQKYAAWETKIERCEIANNAILIRLRFFLRRSTCVFLSGDLNSIFTTLVYFNFNKS